MWGEDSRRRKGEGAADKWFFISFVLSEWEGLLKGMIGGIFRYYLYFEQANMNFEEEFSQPLSHEPSLPDIIQQDKADIAETKSLKF